ncbi:ATP-binding cassette [Aphelenchoides avenae]|nr:ATP-binding cassette [Aphelenchus avenae]
MPSDAKKARDAAKKAAAKQGKKPGAKKPATNGTEPEKDENLQNGHTNGVENGHAEPDQQNGDNGDAELNEAIEVLKNIELQNAQARSVAAVLASHPQSVNIKIDQLTITFHGREIVTDTTLEINMGRRYGLLGLNGSGKSTLIQAIYNREMPIPDHIDMYLVSREMAASNDSALKAVMDVDEEKKMLEKQAEELASCPDDESQEKLMDIYERLDEMDAATAEVRAAEILHGLGFTKQMMLKKCKDFSGGSFALRVDV